MEKDLQKTFYLLAWACLAVVLVFAALVPRLLSGAPCLFFACTGFYCPGCKGTRAILALLNGHPVQSFLYYPAVPYSACVLLWFLFSNTVEYVSKGRLPIGMRFRTGYLYGAVVLIMGNWILENLWLLLH